MDRQIAEAAAKLEAEAAAKLEAKSIVKRRLLTVKAVDWPTTHRDEAELEETSITDAHEDRTFVSS